MTPLPLRVEPLTAAAFAPFGAVIAADPGRSYLINGGTTRRFHALAAADPGPGGTAILSIFRGAPRPLPLTVAMLERHPLGAQAFAPLSPAPWLAVVAEGARPTTRDLRAFLCRGDQGVQYARGVWHHPLIVLGAAQDFLVVDRLGPGANLEEIALDPPGEIAAVET
jgi:ureidoglycolate lyase